MLFRYAAWSYSQSSRGQVLFGLLTAAMVSHLNLSLMVVVFHQCYVPASQKKARRVDNPAKDVHSA